MVKRSELGGQGHKIELSCGCAAIEFVPRNAAKGWSVAFSSDRLQRIRRRIRRWGAQHFQSYSWRHDVDGWLTLVAELFLQRTQARQVEKVYLEFRARYPNPRAVLNADPDDLSRLIGSLGLASRTAVLYEVARVFVDCGESPPSSEEELTAITGVGAYTAAAWLSLHRGQRAVLIDSNVARWLSRMTGNPYNRDPRHVTWVRELADILTPPRAFRDYNYAVLDFTMQVCTPRHPDCQNCPVKADCLYGSTAANLN